MTHYESDRYDEIRGQLFQWIQQGTLKNDVEQALKGAKEYILDARTEKGCLAYNWSLDVNEDGVIYVFEEWATPEDLQLHFSASSYINMLNYLGQFDLQEVETTKHQVTNQSAVYDENGPTSSFS
ncbi:antibiotic biosynthesis monooxygenase [Pseudoalteromonas sp. NBT06-2]|uniref:putative quinol monooxygenase n=1 Tax=Pseudoalteromonas sp. NBT06-2 TaxID=2025950 RepID=UPI001140D5AB|nr:antibiotic biosynthesis monooxygenase [Pseudoalteromonas sp. NBT06-2]